MLKGGVFYTYKRIHLVSSRKRMYTHICLHLQKTHTHTHTFAMETRKTVITCNDNDDEDAAINGR